jgi:hypothetical protein
VSLLGTRKKGTPAFFRISVVPDYTGGDDTDFE